VPAFGLDAGGRVIIDLHPALFAFELVNDFGVTNDEHDEDDETQCRHQEPGSARATEERESASYDEGREGQTSEVRVKTTASVQCVAK
jgi:hypothetical protein